ncbi:MAG TPA: sensor histidine kinase [Christensenellaceae bacterium]|jgi:hypothetical protein|nr:sensor histidine kinase [Christensenellaceae bacterium]
MRDISLHIMDLAQNSLSAGAKLITIDIEVIGDRLTFKLTDDGKGMPKEQVEAVVSPFVSSRTTRKVGLGIPLTKQSAEITGGSFSVESSLGKGTVVSAKYVLSSIDCIPLGDLAGTLLSLISGNPDSVDFAVNIKAGEKSFNMNTAYIKEMLSGISLNEPEVVKWLHGYLDENIADCLGGYIT